MTISPPVSTVWDRVQQNWPSIEADLASEAQLEYTRAKRQAIADAIVLLYAQFAQGEPVPLSVDDQHVLVQQQVADHATLQLLGIARAFYMKSRVSESKNTMQGGSVTNTWADKLRALDSIEGTIRERVRGRALVLPTIMAPQPVPNEGQPVDVPTVSRSSVLDFIDPYARARERG